MINYWLLYVGLFVFFYLALCGALFLLQRFLLYSPEIAKEMPLGWLRLKNNQEGYILGIVNQSAQSVIDNLNEKTDFYQSIQETNKKAVLLFHGNKGNANNKIYYKKLFPGVQLFINEYPGFGFKKHLKPTSQNITKHAKEFIEHILTQYAPEDILLVGESFGTGVASMIAKLYQIPNLILITPYTSLKEVAQSRYWYVPAKYLLKDNFNSIEYLKDYKGHILFIAAEKDETIPVKFAKKLYDKTYKNSSREYILVNNAKHKTWYLHMSREQKLNFKNFFQNFLKH